MVKDGLAWQYQYHLTDHLGNVRVVLSDTNGDHEPEILQDQAYYPFGLEIADLSMSNLASPNGYRYNGKELNEEFGLDWYCYGFRNYDPILARFPSVDPIAEEFAFVSPFNYAENRPINGIDLHGLQYVDANLKFAVDNSKKQITISGNVSLNVKILNMTSVQPSSSVKTFHQKKFRSTFDASGRSTSLHIPLNPNTGKPSGEQYSVRVANDFSANLTFGETINNPDRINRGDVVMIMSNKIENAERDLAGKAELNGHIYSVESEFFNRENNINTHELGHLFAGLNDVKGKNAPSGFLMSYGDDGNGYRLTGKEWNGFIAQLIYRKAINQIKPTDKTNDTREETKDFIKKNGIE